ncbi:feruloyl-CoA synthase [uncultured Tateyamaria sp.]|uniref:feruloyl-CoA synthase n=1 Tax=uncultured Tateyamaria sp. TaxID=455651 RepID=UPI002605C712|nr:feruloyl-CoA synthase [uncultured Tateyamaria sp.]
MTGHLDLRPHKVVREDRADGTILLRSGYEMSAVDRCTGVWLDRWAARTPDAVFLAERSGEGWNTVTYDEALTRVRDLAAGLLARGVDGPILILSGNSVDHALLTLAAQYVGLVTVPVAVQYSLIPTARARLEYVRDLVKPALVYAADDDAFGPALDVFECPKLVSRVVSGRATALDGLTGSVDVDAAHAGVGPETVAKLLLTSGSTSDPKAVVTTHGMMTTNQAQIRDGLPFVSARPPVLVDWLPWNHVFGGSHNFNLVLANGGTLYIDDGTPIPAKFARTVENLGLVSGTISFNVPIGFAQLVAAMERDAALRETYFRHLDMIFYAGASLPQETWSILKRMATEEAGRMPLITSSWGLTETAPAALLQHVPAKGAGIVGVPMTGVTVKLVDDGAGRMDVRVKGGNVFSGYHDAPAKTDEAFDNEGFFITGDAMRFVDPDNMGKGLRFDGRLSEDFKLSTGIWVQAAQIRLEMLALLGSLAQDVVICGAGRDEVGMLVVPGPDAVDGTADNGALCCAVSDSIRHRMYIRSETVSGSARVVARALVLLESPDIGAGEVTAKGNLNFAKLLERRAHLVDRLYDDNDPASIVL